MFLIFKFDGKYRLDLLSLTWKDLSIILAVFDCFKVVKERTYLCFMSIPMSKIPEI